MKQTRIGSNRWWMENYRTSAPRKIDSFKGRQYALYMCGKTPDGYEVWTPLGNAMRAFARIERPGHRHRYVYDPGSHWRVTLTDKH
jgi:hypothetical protein